MPDNIDINKLHLLADDILVEPLQEVVVGGGLVLPAVALRGDDLCRRAVVVAVGRGRTTKKGVLVPPEVVVGDTIVYSRMLKAERSKAFEYRINGKMYLWFSSEQIEARVEA